MTTRTTTVVSSPGKVLIAGGYLVLDTHYSGLVIGTSSRFYSCVSSRATSGTSDIDGHTDTDTCQDEAIISVRAGQFPSDASTWVYSISKPSASASASASADEDGGDRNPYLKLEQTNEEQAGKNKFIFITLCKVLEYVYESILAKVGDEETALDELMKRIKSGGFGGDGLEVVVFADNDFYSQREQLTSLSLPTRISSLPHLPPFTPLPRPIPATNKTGLGSSAALVTSLVGSLLSHLRITHVSPEGGNISDDDKAVIHSVAQLAHCQAQGKVGSGFDVSSAVYGSHLYTRFSPSILTPLMSLAPFSRPRPSTASTSLLDALHPSKWDNKSIPFRLPKHVRLLLADVSCGTDTPSFVSSVLKWRNNDREKADEVWERLDNANRALGEVLRDMVDAEGESDYEKTMMAAAELTSNELLNLHAAPSPSRTLHLLHRLALSLSSIRALLREMSDLSGVPIEPKEQTRLLDACGQVKGVVGGGVPGAGGYDALYLLTVDHPTPLAGVDKLWADWTEMDVCPLSAKQSDGGIRQEEVAEVKGLKEALDRARATG
ncbi:phosphomevalonate kinase [Cryptococcus neoformans Bt1]|nr:phosphomevalonate kinase [Cryptococcus neoformans var. grubii Bt1]OXG12539.1 phosphomevalonate kinase [Cryptococcus neoformans var. grubii Ze90-1]